MLSISGNRFLFFKIDTAGWHGYHYFLTPSPLSIRKEKTMIFQMPKVEGQCLFSKEIIPACSWEKFSDSMNLF